MPRRLTLHRHWLLRLPYHRLKRPLLALALLYTVLIVPVNLLVRALGGSPALLSPFFLGTKLRALGSFALHWPKDIFFDHEDPKLLISSAADRHRVPRELALAVMHAESSMKPHRVSHAGAMGLMQLMPDTAIQLGVSDPFSSVESVEGGVRFLGELWRRYGGDCTRVVAAYNAGPGAVPRSGPVSLSGETSIYVRKVLRSAPCRKIPTASSKRRSR